MFSLKKAASLLLILVLILSGSTAVCLAEGETADTEGIPYNENIAVQEDVDGLLEGLAGNEMSETADLERQSNECKTAGENGDEIEINTIEDLYNIRNNLDKDYILMQDLNLSEATSKGGIYYNSGKGWNPIGSKSQPFKGSFDGNGYTISGLHCNSSGVYNGLFGVNAGVIINLTIEDSYFEGESEYIGSIAGENRGAIDNCEVTSSIKTSGTSYYKEIGGISGLNEAAARIEDCSYYGVIIIDGSCEKKAFAGGVAGENNGNIIGCYNSGELACKIICELNGETYLGGITGICYKKGILLDDTNSGRISTKIDMGDTNVGGIAGSCQGLVERAINSGEVSANRDSSKRGEINIGGIIGYNQGYINVCINKGSVTATSDDDATDINCGGIIGYSEPLFGSDDNRFYACWNQGKINANGKQQICIGGLAGQIKNAILEYSYNTGSVNSNSFNLCAGGLVGEDGWIVVQYSYNAGSVTTSSNNLSFIGGITGSQGWDSVIQECYNSGDISGRGSVGGICGASGSQGANINCYNTGTITGYGDASVGGIFGSLYGDSGLALAYNVGRVKGGKNRCGIIGSFSSTRLSDNTLVTIAFASPAVIDYGKPTGITSTYIDMQKAATYNSFDFNNVWEMGTGSYRFPVLRSVINVEQQNNNKPGKEDTHIFGAWKILKAATENTTGERMHICSGCGYIEKQTIPKLAIVDLKAVKISKPKAAKKAVTVKWKKVGKKYQKKIQGIEIQVSTDSQFQNIVKSTTAGKKKTSKKIKGLKSKTKYWVRIRAYKNASDGKHVSAWKIKTVKVK